MNTKVRYNRRKSYLKYYLKSPRAFYFSINNAVWVQTMQKLSKILSETNRKTERKSRFNLVYSTNSQIQPNTRTAQCARCLFMFLLAVLSHNQIIFQIEEIILALKKVEKISERYREFLVSDQWGSIAL